MKTRSGTARLLLVEGVTREDNLAHLDTIVRGLEWLVDAASAQPRTKCVIVVDTLHLTQCLRPGVLAWRDVIGLDGRLAAIGGSRPRRYRS